MDTDDGEFEMRITHYLMVTVSPVFIIFGTVGNLLSILVMSRKKMRSSNAAVYLITLAIADTGALYFGLLPFFIDAVSGTDIYQISEAICKINTWIVQVTLDIAAWILVAFTFERFLSVCFPHKIKTFCTHKSSIIAVMCIVMVMFAQHSHLLFGFGNKMVTYGNTTQQYYCDIISDNYLDFFDRIYSWIKLCVNCFVPLIIFIVCNSFIAITVLLHRRNMQQITVNRTAKSFSCESLAVLGRQENHSQMIIMLFTVTMVFLITTAPVRVFYIMLNSLLKQLQTYKDYALLLLIHKVVILLMYINNSVNFILYCVTGTRFRNELRKMFRNLCKRILTQNPTNVTEKGGSRRPSLISKQILTEVTELPNAKSLPLEIQEQKSGASLKC